MKSNCVLARRKKPQGSICKLFLDNVTFSTSKGEDANSSKKDAKKIVLEYAKSMLKFLFTTNFKF